jgi:HTH-type transcriptional regulator/antitoxin HigA
MLRIDEVMHHYVALCTQVPLRPIRSEQDYEQALTSLNALLDAGARDEAHPLVDLLDILGDLIDEYENTLLLKAASTPGEILRFLMQQHGLGQSDLPEVGSQGVVSELLAGKRSLNVRQIRALASRFGVSPSLFMDASSQNSSSRVTSKAGSS